MKPQELFDALDRGEMIEFKVNDTWLVWNGNAWYCQCEYRIAQKKESKLVPHWPAVRYWDGLYSITEALFPSEGKALQAASCFGFLRLATELSPIMLEMKE